MADPAATPSAHASAPQSQGNAHGSVARDVARPRTPAAVGSSGRDAPAGTSPDVEVATTSASRSGARSQAGGVAGERLYRQGMYQKRLREEAQREWQAEQQAKELAACTFAPHVAAGAVETATSGDVVARLMQAEKHRRERLEQLARDQSQREMATMRKDARTTHDTSGSGGAVHERLYAEQTERQRRASLLQDTYQARRAAEANHHTPRLVALEESPQVRRNPLGDGLDSAFPAVAQARLSMQTEFGGVCGALYADARVRQQKLEEAVLEEEVRDKLAASGGALRAVRPYAKSLTARKQQLREEIAAAVAALAEGAGTVDEVTASKYVLARVQAEVQRASKKAQRSIARRSTNTAPASVDTSTTAAIKPLSPLPRAPPTAAFVRARTVRPAGSLHTASVSALLQDAAEKVAPSATDLNATASAMNVLEKRPKVSLAAFNARVARWQQDLLRLQEERKQRQQATAAAELEGATFKPHVNARPAYLDRLRRQGSANAAPDGASPPRERRRSFADPTESSSRRAALCGQPEPEAEIVTDAQRALHLRSSTPTQPQRTRRRSADARVPQHEMDAETAPALQQPEPHTLSADAAQDLGGGAVDVRPFVRGLRRHSMHGSDPRASLDVDTAVRTSADAHAAAPSPRTESAADAFDLLTPALRHFYRLFDDDGRMKDGAMDELVVSADEGELAAMTVLLQRAGAATDAPVHGRPESQPAPAPAPKASASRTPKHVPNGYQQSIERAARMRAHRDEERRRAAHIATRSVAYDDPMSPALTVVPSIKPAGEASAHATGRRTHRSAAEQRAALSRLYTGLASDGKAHGHTLTSQAVAHRVLAAEPGSDVEQSLLKVVSPDELATLRELVLAAPNVFSPADASPDEGEDGAASPSRRASRASMSAVSKPARVLSQREHEAKLREDRMRAEHTAAVRRSTQEAEQDVRRIEQTASADAAVHDISSVSAGEPAVSLIAAGFGEQHDMVGEPVAVPSLLPVRPTKTSGTSDAIVDAAADRISRLLASLGIADAHGTPAAPSPSATVREFVAAASMTSPLSAALSPPPAFTPPPALMRASSHRYLAARSEQQASAPTESPANARQVPSNVISSSVQANVAPTGDPLSSSTGGDRALLQSPLTAFLHATQGVGNSSPAIAPPPQAAIVQPVYDDASTERVNETRTATVMEPQVAADASPVAPSQPATPLRDASMPSTVTPLQAAMARIASARPLFPAADAALPAKQSASSEKPRDVRSPVQRRLLARIEVAVAPGVSVPIEFFEGDSPAALARIFVAEHELQALPGLEDVLTAMIQGAVREVKAHR